MSRNEEQGPIDGWLRKVLGDLDLHEFKCWAFGEEYDNSQVPLEFMEAWNVRHKELELFPDGLLFKDLEKMVKLYKETQCANGLENSSEG